MKSGHYYVGDLCYVFNDEQWDKVCWVTLDPNDQHNVLGGEFIIDQDIPFAMYRTAYGDGRYYDQYGNEYAVDSGSIGCVETKYCDRGKLDEAIRNNLGHPFAFQIDFTTRENNGIIIFGGLKGIKIDTDPKEEDEEEDY